MIKRSGLLFLVEYYVSPALTQFIDFDIFLNSLMLEKI